jgi:hypothetical protein
MVSRTPSTTGDEASLPNLAESESLQNPGDLAGLEDRYVAHLRDLEGLCPDELAFELRLAVLEQH